MDLTYTADWIDHAGESSTLTIGIYDAHVYAHRTGGYFHWWVRSSEPGSDETTEIARGKADDKKAGQAAVEAAIRADHATH